MTQSMNPYSPQPDQVMNLAYEKNSRHGQSGFGFSALAIVIALIMGLTVTMVFRQVATQSAELGEVYSASQAHWTAMSGIEWGIHKAELGESDVLGTFNFFNSTVNIDTSAIDESGTPLTLNWYRVMCVGQHGMAESRIRIIAAFSLQTAWADVSIIEQKADIKDGFRLNDSLYIGDDIDVESGTFMGDPPGEPTHIYHPIEATVTGGQEDAYFTSGVHPRGDLFLPDFDNTFYDEIIAIAQGVTSTSGNEIKGKTVWERETLDLSIYDDNTLYVNGEVQFKGAHITGGTLEEPGIIVSDDKVTLKKAKAKGKNPEVQTTADDNIILVSKKDIQVNDETYFGLDHTDSLTAADRPITTNELYAKDDLKISAGTVAWGQLYCRDDIKLEGKVYGICLAPSKFTFEKTTSYLEGAVFAQKLNKSDLKEGQMVLNHIFHEEFFKIINYGVEDNSLYEY